jgi:hypothetical protein
MSFENTLTKIVHSYQEQKNIDLYIPYYQDKNPARYEELKLCLQLNIQNKLFKHIYILNQWDSNPDFIQQSDRVRVIYCSRPQFQDIFRCSATLSDKNDIKVLINTDIVIGENFDRITLTDNQFICLSRYDVMDDGQFKINVGGASHDCWMWKNTPANDIGKFYMGKFLCDGVLANQLQGNLYKLKNPVNGLKIYHVHLTGVRNRSIDDIVLGWRTGVNFSDNDGIFVDGDMYCDGCNSS